MQWGAKKIFIIKKIINWIIPITCYLCGFKSARGICESCIADLPWLKRVCQTCAIDLAGHMEELQCGECSIDPPLYDRLFVLFNYDFPINSLISKLKFRKQINIAYPIGELFAEFIAEFYLRNKQDLPRCIIPVPLHAKRLRARGYNQALELARPIKKKLDIPICINFIERTRMTVPQTLLEGKERAMNVKKVFSMRKKLSAKHIAIVDDVITTRSTVSELAKLLRSVGVEKIDVWCVARVSTNK